MARSGRLKPCKRCGTEFYVTSSRDVGGAHGEKMFCSKECAGAARNEVPNADRFWSKVTKGEGCWLWNASTNDDGYGHFRSAEGKFLNAHRFSYRLHKGEIPAGMSVMHACDTPACVNPDHLSLGSHADNLGDMARKGRGTQGEKNKGSKLTEADVLALRKMRAETGKPYYELGPLFGISTTQARGVCKRTSWKHL